MITRAKELIQQFNLSKHPEGGYFREVYRSKNNCTIGPSGDVKSWLTDIYFLLTGNDISRFHRVKHDEIWHFYEGDPLVLTEIYPVSMEIHTITIGQPGPSLNYKHCVKGSTWQSAYTIGEYSFVGCTVGPGFEFVDFEMLANNNTIKTTILSKYPELEKFI